MDRITCDRISSCAVPEAPYIQVATTAGMLSLIHI